jgi:hypothetical protein
MGIAGNVYLLRLSAKVPAPDHLDWVCIKE